MKPYLNKIVKWDLCGYWNELLGYSSYPSED